MENNIVLISLIHDSNLGDQAIAYSTEMMVREILKRKKYSIEIDTIDMQGRVNTENDNGFVSQSRIKRTIKSVFPKTVHKIVEHKLSEDFKRLCQEHISEKTKAILFVGGGLIKYKKQFMVQPIRIAIEMAKHYEIPVMFSGVGVEGFEYNNKECLRLAESINDSHVKYITTRDDIECLRRYYITNDQIITDIVADPACSIAHYVKQDNRDNNVIGLGIGRAELFSDYGINLKEDKLTDLWVDIYNFLLKKGYKCQLFTNGSADDQLYAAKIAKAIGDSSILINRPTSLKELIEIINGFKGIIGTRLHTGIIAYSYNIPCVEFVWNNKQKMFGSIINCKNNYIEKEQMDCSIVCSRLFDAISRGYPQEMRKSYIDTTQKYIEEFLMTYVMRN